MNKGTGIAIKINGKLIGAELQNHYDLCLICMNEIPTVEWKRHTRQEHRWVTVAYLSHRDIKLADVPDLFAYHDEYIQNCNT